MNSSRYGGKAGLSIGEKNSSRIEPFHVSGKPSFHRRAFCHDYFAPFIYHIILKKTRNCEIFGSITGDAKILPGTEGCAEINESALGRIIAKEIIHLPYEYPALKPLQFKVMPDHVHMIIQVLFRTDKDLDFYIDFLKKRICNKYSQLKGKKSRKNISFKEDIATNPFSMTAASMVGMNI